MTQIEPSRPPRAEGPLVACAVSGAQTPRRAARRLDELRPGLQERLLRDHPDLAPDALLSRAVIDRYLRGYIEAIIQAERGELTMLDKQVADSMAREATISANIESNYASDRTLGERMADRLASFGGSWTFLGVFAVLMTGWMAANSLSAARAFDPFPYILLNLVLSCIAAIQAPVIMMSQKRQEAKDRLRSLSDYQVNLKAELEIRHLHDKIDHLISRQWDRLAEIQRLQVELLQDRRK